jgi:hypothetical protein
MVTIKRFTDRIINMLQTLMSLTLIVFVVFSADLPGSSLNCIFGNGENSTETFQDCGTEKNTGRLTNKINSNFNRRSGAQNRNCIQSLHGLSFQPAKSTISWNNRFTCHALTTTHSLMALRI